MTTTASAGGSFFPTEGNIHIIGTPEYHRILRIMQQILLEIRRTQQYTQFIHATLTSAIRMDGPKETKTRARRKAAQTPPTPPATTTSNDDDIARILQRRKEMGLGDQLTAEEEAAFARGEVPETFQL